jgi:hypothetical protein
LLEEPFATTGTPGHFAVFPESCCGAAAAIRQYQVSGAPHPDEVAKKVLAIAEGTRRLRQPADGRAKLLSFLRRFAPAGQVDKSLRRAFGLKA